MNMEITTLGKRPDLYDETISLIESELDYDSSQSFKVDFFSLLQGNQDHLYIALKDGKLIGHVGALEKKFEMSKNYTCTLLGGIVTHKDFQGQGVLRSLLGHVINQYEKDTTLFILWSDLVNLYKKFGFSLAGGIIHSKQQVQETSSLFIKTKYKDLSDDEKLQVQGLYNEHKKRYFSFERSPIDWSLIEQITSSDLFLLKKDKINAYYFQSKGQDLPGVIFELVWDQSLDFNNIYKQLAHEVFWLPESEKAYFKEYEISYLALMKIGNLQIFSDFVKDYTQERIIIKNIDKSNITIIFDGNEYEFTVKDFLMYLWGPNPLQEFHDFSKSFFISGLESI